MLGRQKTHQHHCQSVDVPERKNTETDILTLAKLRIRNVESLDLTRHVVMACLHAFGASGRPGRVAQERRGRLVPSSPTQWFVAIGPNLLEALEPAIGLVGRTAEKDDAIIGELGRVGKSQGLL
jgi:hypothetical protein